MDSVRTLILGAGVTGLATAAALGTDDLLVLEADAEPGGYCKTVRKNGFTWDYSGHFFHFKHPEIERWLRERMPGQRVRTVTKRSFIRFQDRLIDFPFQKNIHQLPRQAFIDCLVDLYFARAPRELLGPGAPGRAEPGNFLEMLHARYGRSIAELFLIPYNEKLYACDLGTLEVEAMGRFFPHAELTDVIRNMRAPENGGYNATFTYPEGGAVEYVKALLSAVPAGRVALGEPALSVDLQARTVTTPRRTLRYERLVSSAPLPRLLELAGRPAPAGTFRHNRVLVFNLGFDAKGPRGVHWIYYPDRSLVFYRVGFYDNIFDSERMSLYVEVGLPPGPPPDVERLRARVLDDLGRVEVVGTQRLIAEHHVLMDPAYVHVTRAGEEAKARARSELGAHDVHSIGRYGGWTYCSIEDNIVEARALVERIGA